MARDIEEFLRRAAERRKQQQSGSAPAPAPAAPQQPEKPRSIAPKSRPAVPEIAEAIVVEDVEIIEPSRLKSSIDTSDISRHADALGKGITSTHDRVEHEVHKHLDHNVGKIDDTPTITDDPSPAIVGKQNSNAAKELKKLLSSPKSVGQAIIIAEILKRPNFD